MEGLVSNIAFELEKLQNSYKTKVLQRQFANRSLVDKLSNLVDKHPDLRFGQILIAYGFVKSDTDLFYEEPIDTLKNIRDDNSE